MDNDDEKKVASSTNAAEVNVAPNSALTEQLQKVEHAYEEMNASSTTDQEQKVEEVLKEPDFSKEREKEAQRRLQAALDNRRALLAMRNNASDIRVENTISTALANIWQLELLIYFGKQETDYASTEPAVTAKTLYIRTEDSNLIQNICEAFSSRHSWNFSEKNNSNIDRNDAKAFIINQVMSWYPNDKNISVKVCNVVPLLSALSATQNVREVVRYETTIVNPTTEAYVRAQSKLNAEAYMASQSKLNGKEETVVEGDAEKMEHGNSHVEFPESVRNRWKRMVTGVSVESSFKRQGPKSTMTEEQEGIKAKVLEHFIDESVQ
jgi:hypothetical protein